VVVGPNGHGKTNLIEALLYGEVFRSFRGAADREMVRFGEDGFRIDVECGRTVAAGYDARTRQKRVTVDGVEQPRIADAIGIVRGVVLSPRDVELVAGEPRERRRYLDVLLALTVHGYVHALGRYRRALLHRSRAAGPDVDAFEQVLAEAGATIWTARQTWAQRWSASYAVCCEAMGEAGASAMDFAPRTGNGAGGHLGESALREALERTRAADRTTGRTSVGPHRDELRLVREDRLLRHYGSAGQQRTAAIALRLVEAEAMAESGAPTLLCLDDAFAVLVERRVRRLGELIAAKAKAGWQIVAAVPKDSDLPDVVGALPRWSIDSGRITA